MITFPNAWHCWQRVAFMRECDTQWRVYAITLAPALTHWDWFHLIPCTVKLRYWYWWNLVLFYCHSSWFADGFAWKKSVSRKRISLSIRRATLHRMMKCCCVTFEPATNICSNKMSPLEPCFSPKSSLPSWPLDIQCILWFEFAGKSLAWQFIRKIKVSPW